MLTLREVLKKQNGFAPVIHSTKPFKKLDFSESNEALVQRDLSETSVFSQFVFDEMLENNAFTGIGGYA
jgi:hypothetical protein